MSAALTSRMLLATKPEPFGDAMARAASAPLGSLISGLERDLIQFRKDIERAEARIGEQDQ